MLCFIFTDKIEKGLKLESSNYDIIKGKSIG